jgi:glutaminase
MKSPVHQILQSLHERYASLHDGKVADYIPELAKADPNWFGICVATRDGHLYEVGDTRQKFSIQ